MKPTIQAEGEAMPAKKATYEQVADAMRELEEAVVDLTHMARIANDIAERLFSRPVKKLEDTLVFHVSLGERETFLFSLNDVEKRADRLKKQYLNAWDGEIVQ